MLKRQSKNETGRVGDVGFELLQTDLDYSLDEARSFLRDALLVDPAVWPTRFLAFAVAVQRVFMWGPDDVIVMVARAAARRPLKSSLAVFNRVGFTSYAEALRAHDPCFLVRTCEQEEVFLGLLSEEDLEAYALACSREPTRWEHEQRFTEADVLDEKKSPTADEVIRVPEVES